MMERDSRPNILIVMHQAHSTPGRIGCILNALGARLDIRRPSLDEALPETLDDHDGVVVFGGPMCANDDCEWIEREIAWLETPLREDKPLLGIYELTDDSYKVCFGPPGGERPTEFASKPGSKVRLIVMKREKP